MDNVKIAEALRTDLQLRAEFAQISTQIYEKDKFQFIIKIECGSEEFLEIKEHFDSKLRPMHVNIRLIESDPPCDFRRIEPLTDNNIGNSVSGTLFFKKDFETLLIGSIKDLPDVTIGEFNNEIVEIVHVEKLEQEQKSQISSILEPLISVQKITFLKIDGARKIKERRTETGSKLEYHPLTRRGPLPDFVKEEEYDWHNNLGQLFAGHISPSHFDFTANSGKSCLLTARSDTLDIRQVLLAYDTIYLQTPSLTSEEFWANQNISQDDLLLLIEHDKVRLVCTHQEEFSDIGLLNAANAINPRGVIGSRKLTSYLIADIIETDKNYLLSRNDFSEGMKRLCYGMAEQTGTPAKEIANLLFYPRIARQKCMRPFNLRGPNGLLGFCQGNVFAEEYKRVRGQDLWLEATIFSRDIHIAHALNSTLMPAWGMPELLESWMMPLQMMGNRLNFYRGLNTKVIAKWANHNRRPVEERKTILPAIPLIDFRDDIEVQDLLDLSSSEFSRYGARSLISRLSDLPIEQRESELTGLTVKLRDYEKRKRNIQNGFIAFDVIATAGLYAAGVSSPVGTSLLSVIKKAAEKISVLSPMVEEINYSLSDVGFVDSELEFLSKVNRVAEIRNQK